MQQLFHVGGFAMYPILFLGLGGRDPVATLAGLRLQPSRPHGGSQYCGTTSLSCRFNTFTR
jgi:hypothetical protein